MSTTRHTADHCRAAFLRDVFGRALLVLALLLASTASAWAGTAARCDEAAATGGAVSAFATPALLAAPGDSLPPQGLHHTFECKMGRQTALVPVSRAPHTPGLAACWHPVVVALSRIRSDVTLPDARRIDAVLAPDPQLRLRPGQAPPAA